MSPIVAKLMVRDDPRWLVCFGIRWLATTSYLWTFWFSGADFWTLSFPQMLQGIGMPFFFIPLTAIALGAIEPEETASAAGVMSFLRTMAGAIGTSVSTTLCANSAVFARSGIVSRLNSALTVDGLEVSGIDLEGARGMVEQTVTQESYALAINHLFLLSAIVLVGAALVIWLSPQPARAIEAGAAH